VVWWTSRFDHSGKRHFDAPAGERAASQGLSLWLLSARGYQKNISIARLVDHFQVGVAFRRGVRREAAPDIILCSFPTIELSLAAASFGQRRQIPVVLDVRDLWPDVFLDFAPRFLRPLARGALAPYFSAARCALGRAAAIVAVSTGYLEWGVGGARRAPTEWDRVFPLGYATQQTRASVGRSSAKHGLAKFGARADRVTCIFSGSFGRTYDLSPILELADSLESEGFQFLICGEGEQGERWRRQAAGSGNVFFTGWLQRQDLELLLQASDIGVAAYAAGAPQGIPNKVIEYLAAGLPVVSSLSGEAEDLLSAEHCGLTYDVSDPDTLRSALLRLREASERNRMADCAARVFNERFRAEHVYAEFADYLEQLVRRRREAGSGRD